MVGKFCDCCIYCCSLVFDLGVSSFICPSFRFVYCAAPLQVTLKFYYCDNGMLIASFYANCQRNSPLIKHMRNNYIEMNLVIG